MSWGLKGRFVLCWAACGGWPTLRNSGSSRPPKDTLERKSVTSWRTLPEKSPNKALLHSIVALAQRQDMMLVLSSIALQFDVYMQKFWDIGESLFRILNS